MTATATAATIAVTLEARDGRKRTFFEKYNAPGDAGEALLALDRAVAELGWETR